MYIVSNWYNIVRILLVYHSLLLLGKPMKLSKKAEEAATFFAKMLDHDYTTKDIFCKNFFEDWRKVREQHKEKIYPLVEGLYDRGNYLIGNFNLTGNEIR